MKYRQKAKKEDKSYLPLSSFILINILLGFISGYSKKKKETNNKK